MKAILFNAQQGRQAFEQAYLYAKPLLMAEQRLVLEVKEATRSLEQNALLWATLGEIAAQVDWYGQKLSADDWKHVLSASLRKQRVAPGLDGGFVVLGQKTSRMTKAEFSEFLELAFAFGAQHGVRFSAPEHSEVTA